MLTHVPDPSTIRLPDPLPCRNAESDSDVERVLDAVHRDLDSAITCGQRLGSHSCQLVSDNERDRPLNFRKAFQG